MCMHACVCVYTEPYILANPEPYLHKKQRYHNVSILTSGEWTTVTTMTKGQT